MAIDIPALDEERAWQPGAGLGPGRHPAVVETAEESPSSGGTPGFCLTFRAVAGTDDGGTIRDWVYVTPKTLGRVKAYLQNLGYTIPAGAFKLDLARLCGRPCWVIVREEQKRGADGFPQVDEESGLPVMRNVVKAVEAREGPAPTVAGAAGGGGASQAVDEDIPF